MKEVTLLLLVMIGLFIIGTILPPIPNHFPKECKEAGGIPVKNICLNPSAVIEIRRDK